MMSLTELRTTISSCPDETAQRRVAGCGFITSGSWMCIYRFAPPTSRQITHRSTGSERTFHQLARCNCVHAPSHHKCVHRSLSGRLVESTRATGHDAVGLCLHDFISRSFALQRNRCLHQKRNVTNCAHPPCSQHAKLVILRKGNARRITRLLWPRRRPDTLAKKKRGV